MVGRLLHFLGRLWQGAERESSLFNFLLRLVGVKNHVHNPALGRSVDHRNLPGFLVGSRIPDRSWEVSEGRDCLEGNAGHTTTNSAY